MDIIVVSNSMQFYKINRSMNQKQLYMAVIISYTYIVFMYRYH